MPQLKKSALVKALEAAAKGLQTGVLPTQTFKINQKVLPVADAAKLYESFVALYTAEEDAERRLTVARAAVEAAQPAIREALEAMKEAAYFLLGKSNPEVERLGVSMPKKPAELSVEAKVLKAARARATRELRGTKGKKAKAAIHSTVEPVVLDAPGHSTQPATPVTPNTTKPEIRTA